MSKFAIIFQILISGILILFILLQNKSTGLESSLGKESSFTTKKGGEKLIFMTTVLLASLFLLAAIFNTLISLK